MTTHLEKPSARAAWSMTAAAALDLFAFVLLARGNASVGLLILFGLCVIVLILAATGTWKAYVEKYIAFSLQASRLDTDA